MHAAQTVMTRCIATRAVQPKGPGAVFALRRHVAPVLGTACYNMHGNYKRKAPASHRASLVGRRGGPVGIATASQRVPELLAAAACPIDIMDRSLRIAGEKPFRK